MCPARLGLARVSVVRGAGERAGEPCIDDYIQAVEPVHDYLTKWSGLVRAPVARWLGVSGPGLLAGLYVGT